MNRILIIKTSSMGDIVHTLPALTEASKKIPGLVCDWVVEEMFEAIPRLHPLVERVIPIAIRRWRGQLIKSFQEGEYSKFLKELRQEKYCLVIDAQGLIKSSVICLLARGYQKGGYHWKAAREPLASMFYGKHYKVPSSIHAITKIRMLFAELLNYSIENEIVEYGLSKNLVTPSISLHSPYILLLHGTSRPNKCWQNNKWIALANILKQRGYTITLFWSNEAEKERVHIIVKECPHVVILPKLSLQDIIPFVAHAAGTVAVDTGLGHLAAAFGVPGVSLYGPTNADLIGSVGKKQRHLDLNNTEPMQIADELNLLMTN